MNVLVTGGAGYIGSHAALRLARDGHRVLIVDDLSRGHRAAVDIIQAEAPQRVRFLQADVADVRTILPALREERIEAVLHFAALAYVGESVQQPLRYYRVNTAGGIALLHACLEAGVTRFVFSSSCATYGEPADDLIPIGEDCPQRPISPYGRSKLHLEQVLRDEAEARCAAGRPWALAILRYFNVAGCDLSGRLGEDHDPETHLIPRVLRAAMGRGPALTIFGTDYPTPDGTCIRDYVHVDDLIDAHVRALERLEAGRVMTYNVGLGRGWSVREVIAAAERVVGAPIPVVAGARRAGDPPRLFAQADRIVRDLGWSPAIDELEGIIASAWSWFRSHPAGYGAGI